MSFDTILQKYGLLQEYTFKLTNTNQEQFKQALENIVQKGSLSFHSDIFEVLFSNKKKYVGSIQNNSFQIRKRRKIFEVTNFSITEGKFYQEDNNTIVQTTTHYKTIAIYFIPLILFYIFGAILIFTLAITRSDFHILGFLLPLLLHLSIFWFLFVYSGKRYIKCFASNLEQELSHITKQ